MYRVSIPAGLKGVKAYSIFLSTRGVLNGLGPTLGSGEIQMYVEYAAKAIFFFFFVHILCANALRHKYIHLSSTNSFNDKSVRTKNKNIFSPKIYAHRVRFVRSLDLLEFLLRFGQVQNSFYKPRPLSQRTVKTDGNKKKLYLIASQNQYLRTKQNRNASFVRKHSSYINRKSCAKYKQIQ